MGKQKAAPPMRFEPSDFSEAVDYCRQSGYMTQK